MPPALDGIYKRSVRNNVHMLVRIYQDHERNRVFEDVITLDLENNMKQQI